jgi:hypothetical protein
MDITDEFNSINTKFENFLLDKNIITNENVKLKKQLELLEIQYTKKCEECDNYSKVSVVKNLHNQIYDKDQLISFLEKKIEKLSTLQISPVKEVVVAKEVEVPKEVAEVTNEVAVEVTKEVAVEVTKEVAEVTNEVAESGEEVAEVTNEVAEVEESCEEDDVDFYEKKLKPPNCKRMKLFLITDDEHRDIYEINTDGEPGKHIGKLTGKQNKPVFF